MNEVSLNAAAPGRARAAVEHLQEYRDQLWAMYRAGAVSKHTWTRGTNEITNQIMVLTGEKL
jgi:hypothetical protein